MAGPKDDEDVVRFMALYAKLREWTDDDPIHVVGLAAEDESFKKLCLNVQHIAFLLSIAEKRKRRLYAAPVDPKFLTFYRDYEQRYSAVLGYVFLADIGLDVDASTRPQSDVVERRWEFAADEARERAGAIGSVFDFAKDQVECRDFPEDFVEEIERGISEWKSLTVEAGLDLEGIIRRHEIVPFVLIPRHVSRHHGDAEKLSLLTHLQQAHEAFVYGVPFAAIALLRSILEVTLKNHYGATGGDLTEYINNVSGLPSAVKRETLHKLRRLANSIMHFNKQLVVEMPRDMERELLFDLHTVRSLIEGAPSTLDASRARRNNG
jgi:hypothetical protein